MNDQQKAWMREQRAMEMRMWYGVKTQEELLNKLKMNKIVVSKECVDNYEKYKELQKKLTELKDQLEKVNTDYSFCGSIIHHIELQNMYIATLYRSNKQLINKTLNQEVQRLEQELDNYIIE